MNMQSFDQIPAPEQWRQRCRQLTTTAFIDSIAAQFPGKPIFSVPVDSKNVEKGWKDVSFREFSRAIDRAAWWLVKRLGKPREPFETIHLILPQDLRNWFFFHAAIKAGYKCLYCHPGFGPDMHVHLHNVSSSKTVIFDDQANEQVISKVKAVAASDSDTKTFSIEPLDFWLADDKTSESTRPFMYKKGLAEAANDPFNVVHSSGTTGPPKCIIHTHNHVLQQVLSYVDCAEEQNLTFPHFRAKRVGMLFPQTAGASVVLTFGLNFLYDFVVVLPPDGPFTADALDNMIKYADIDAAACSPRVFPDLLADSGKLKRLSTLKFLMYIGLTAPKDQGDAIARHVHLASNYGSTETGSAPVLVVDSSDWAYLKFDPNYGYEMRPMGTLGYHVLVLKRFRSTGLEQTPFQIYPHEKEWNMKDIFVKHPDPAKAGKLWRYLGRTDDLVTGKCSKTAPTADEFTAVEPFIALDMEAVIQRDEKVESACITDNRDGLIAVTVEPKICTTVSTPEERNMYITSIWPSIEKAQKICPTKARMLKGLIIVADKPVQKGPKGFPVRHTVLSDYRDAIDAVYAARMKSEAKHSRL